MKKTVHKAQVCKCIDYQIRVINFINPEHSDGWNPLYMIAKSYIEETVSKSLES